MLINHCNVVESANATSINFFDTTGTGSTGYGGSNPTTANFISAQLQIYAPDSVTFLVSPTLFKTVNMYPSMPSVDKHTPFVITAASLGITKFQDGEYLFNYLLSTSTTDYKASVLKIFSASACCCVQSSLTNVKVCGCEHNESAEMPNQLFAMMRSMNYLTSCRRQREAICLLKDINRICLKTANCKNC